MKKLFLITAILVCSIGTAQDKQDTKLASKPLKYGFKLGLNFAKLTDSDSGTTRNGLNVGAYLNYKFSDKFAFQPELLYTAQGMKEEGTSEGIDIKLTYKLDYIAIPLMIKYYPVKNFNFEFGPQLAFNVKKELEAKGNGQTLDFDLDDFFNDNGIDAKTNTFDLALNFGLGYELANGLNFSGRYSMGLTKVFEGSDVVDNNGNSQDIKNSVFTFGLGYSFK
jgi:hypothetical protein